jgi:hypothetical protein
VETDWVFHLVQHLHEAGIGPVPVLIAGAIYTFVLYLSGQDTVVGRLLRGVYQACLYLVGIGFALIVLAVIWISI